MKRFQSIHDVIVQLIIEGQNGGEFAQRYDLPHRSNPLEDLDMASYGVVKVLENHPGHTYPDMSWEPKAAFATLADYYRG